MKKIILAISVIAFVMVISIAVAWSLKPSRAVIKSADKPVATAQSNESVVLKTAYFNVTLPSGFVVKNQTENANPLDVMQITATKSNANGRQVAISIGVLPEEGLAGVSSYNLRVKNPDTYKKTEFGGMPAGIPTFFSSADSIYGITGFWVNGSLYAAITISGIDSDRTIINQTYATLLDAWAWK